MTENLPEARDQVCPTCNGVGAVPQRRMVAQQEQAQQLALWRAAAQLLYGEILMIERARTVDKMRFCCAVAMRAFIRLTDRLTD